MENNSYPQKLISPLYDELVPPEGNCNTLEGELLRSLVRISQVYFYEEGEFFHGLGSILAGPAASFLKSKTTSIEELSEIPEILYRMQVYSITYIDGVLEIESLIYEYIHSLDGQYSLNTEDMMNFNSEWDVDLSQDRHVDDD